MTYKRSYGSSRRRSTVRGSGGYIFSNAPVNGYVPGLGKTLGSAAGNWAGRFISGATGTYTSPLSGYLANIGGSLGDRFGKWSGMGKYTYSKGRSYPSRKASYARGRPSGTVVKRTRTTTTLSPATASFSVSGDGVRVRHREYICDIGAGGVLNGGSTSFNLEKVIAINPGLQSSFPWLASIASSFTAYQWKGLMFQYVTTSGNAVSAANAALGDVMLATDYNPGAGQFINKQQMLNEDFAMSTVPSRSITHPVEVNPRKTTVSKLFVRQGALNPNQDIKSYDIGTFNLATNGVQTNCQLGELWVSYDIVLYKPSLQLTGQSLQSLSAHYRQTLPSGSAAPQQLLPFASGVTYDNIGLTLTPNNSVAGAGGSITFPVGTLGTYMIHLLYNGSTAASTYLTAPALTNCRAVNILSNDGGYASYGPNASTSTAYLTVVVAISDSTRQAVVSWATNSYTFPGGNVNTDLIVSQINSATIL